MSTEVVHAAPLGHDATMPCCRRTPLEAPRSDRMSLDPAKVTCGSNAARALTRGVEGKSADGDAVIRYPANPDERTAFDSEDGVVGRVTTLSIEGRNDPDCTVYVTVAVPFDPALTGPGGFSFGALRLSRAHDVPAITVHKHDADAVTVTPAPEHCDTCACDDPEEDSEWERARVMAAAIEVEHVAHHGDIGPSRLCPHPLCAAAR